MNNHETDNVSVIRRLACYWLHDLLQAIYLLSVSLDASVLHAYSFCFKLSYTWQWSLARPSHSLGAPRTRFWPMKYSILYVAYIICVPCMATFHGISPICRNRNGRNAIPHHQYCYQASHWLHPSCNQLALQQWMPSNRHTWSQRVGHGVMPLPHKLLSKL